MENSESIEDARVLCQAFSMALEHAFISKKKEYKVKDLKLIDMLKDDEKTGRWKVLLELFQEESLPAALEMINEFPREMDLWIREEMKERKLDSLKGELLD